MTFGSFCSGIEAASVAWLPMGWEPLFFSEIDPFCNLVLSYHYPTVENIGDVNNADFGIYAGKCDLLVGGTPCQSFSVAGKREGMDDPRGQLVWKYVEFLGICRPRWFIWENVRNVLRIGAGEVFRQICGAFIDSGYSIAWRVLDGRDFATPQPRKRVFVIGHFGKDWRPPSAILFEPPGDLFDDCESGEEEPEGSPMVARTLLTRPFRADSGGCLFDLGSVGARIYDTSSGCTLTSNGGGQGAKTGLYRTDMGVRTLTPLECERYMGFPEDYTDIPFRGKRPSSNMRIKALGNSIIPEVLRFLGRRIELWEEVHG
jgi:DNA (cytosine-5)-methyltransferase 1